MHSQYHFGWFISPAAWLSRLLTPHLARGLVAVALVCFAGAVSAQPDPRAALWGHLSETPREKIGAERWVQPLRGQLFLMDDAAVRARLGKVRVAEPALAAQLGTEIELPMPDGTTARFKIVDAPVMAPELAARFPEIKTYAGQGLDDPSTTVRLDLTPAGFHAQILSPNGAVYVDPAFRGDARFHVSYYKRDLKQTFDMWRCFVGENKPKGAGGTTSGEISGVDQRKTQSGGTLRTYRLAVAATGEYTAFHGGTVALGQSAIVTAINRVNGVFETELAVRLVLVANNSLLVYTNSATDPYSNLSNQATLDANQANINLVIGSANYDIGHVFCTDVGGFAQTPSVCTTGKARGSTGLPQPIGDAFWIDFVAHELGHQFGANHTFNSETDFCLGARNGSTAFEPGSGSTIMAYAGTCFPNNLQSHSDPYFHAGSLDEIQSTIATVGTCASNSATINTAPIVNAGSDYTIPASTPFVLTATGSDPNSDPITYCWEQMDTGAAAGLGDPDDGGIPLFRSLPPTNTPARYFPRLSSVLAGTNWNQERLPSASRTLDFRVTVRDNRAGGGGVADDDMQVTVAGSAGPFVVTTPNTGVAWSGARTVTWNVAGTASPPINASGVNVHLSTNGGATFSFLLASNVPNSGSALVVMPNVDSSRARIKVQGAGNIFYDVSDVNFSVSPGVPTPLVQSTGVALLTESCSPANGFIDPFESVTVNWSLSNFGTGATTNLVATLLTSNGVYCISNGVYLPGQSRSYGVIPAGSTVSRSFTFVPAGVCGGSITGLLQTVDGGAPAAVFSHVFGLGASQGLVSTQVFANAFSVLINDAGRASPYPSTISVSGVTNPVDDFTVILNGLSHDYSEDVNVLLVSPGGENVALMTYAGEGPVSNVTLAFNDSAADPVPLTGTIPTGVYFPSDYELVFASPHNFPSPAPGRPYGDMLAPLLTSPNGTWSLYFYDVYAAGDGTLSGGWSMEFVSSNLALECCEVLPPAGATTAAYSNNLINLSWQSLPGVHYQVQHRTNLAAGSWQAFGAPMAGTGFILTTNDIVVGSPLRFYRIQVVP